MYRSGRLIKDLYTQNGNRIITALSIVILTVLSLTYASVSTSASLATGSPVLTSTKAQNSNKPAIHRKIEAGQVVEESIKGGDTHSYQFDLDAGMYLRVTVEQKGITVETSILDESGEKIHQSDRAGTERLSVIAGPASTYVIEINSGQRAGAAGTYVLRLEDLHAARPEDVQRLRAEMLVLEGVKLGRQQNKESNLAAVEKFQAALKIWDKLADSNEQAFTHSMLAFRLDRLNRYEEAISHNLIALRLSRQNGDRYRESTVLGHLGTLHKMLENTDRALEYYNEAINLSRELDDKLSHFSYLANTGVIYKDRGQHARALNIYNEALTVIREIGNKRIEATILNNLARLFDLTGDNQNSYMTYEKLLPVWRELGDLEGEATTLKNLAAILEARGDYKGALAEYSNALDLSMRLGNPNHEAHIRADIARTQNALGNHSEAEIEIIRSLTIFESLRSKLSDPQFRATFSSNSRKYYDLLMDLTVRKSNQRASAGDKEEIFKISERARARSMIEMLNEANIDFKRGLAPALVAREEELRKQIRAKDSEQIRMLAKTSTAEKGKNIARELLNLTSEYEHVLAEMRSNNPRLSGITEYKPVSIVEVQEELLDDRTLLLEYYLGSDKSYLMAVGRGYYEVFTLPARKEIEDSALKLYEALSAPGVRIRFESDLKRQERLRQAQKDLSISAGHLSGILLEPVKDRLGNKRLLIVADGALQYLPFAVLPIPNAQKSSKDESDTTIPMVVRHEIVNLTSANAQLTMSRTKRLMTSGVRSIAVIADPVFSLNDERLNSVTARNTSGDTDPSTASVMEDIITRGLDSRTGFSLPRLPYSRNEGTNVASYGYKPASFLAMDFNASYETLNKQALDSYRYLHIATHGLMNSRQPTKSGLILSMVDEKGSSRNGAMNLNDIYNLRLSAELVVLSACQTALGRDIRGEGIMGLSNGFMYAGGRRVMSSLWLVDDAATAELMKIFYKGMFEEGLTPAASLRAAQTALWKKDGWNAPYFWAGFIMQGEHR